MKTHREIVLEALRLEESARRFADEQRRNTTERSPRDMFWVLFAFPESHFTSHIGDANDASSVHTHRMLRRIEAAIVGDALEYRLVEDELETTASGELVAENKPVLLLKSDTALEVLEEGYEFGEQERLSDSLAPFVERAEAGEFAEGIEPQVIEEIETLVSAGELLPASRIHARSDIVKLLDGRIEPDAFINAAIERQRHCEILGENIAERPSERMTIGHP